MRRIESGTVWNDGFGKMSRNFRTSSSSSIKIVFEVHPGGEVLHGTHLYKMGVADSVPAVLPASAKRWCVPKLNTRS